MGKRQCFSGENTHARPPSHSGFIIRHLAESSGNQSLPLLGWAYFPLCYTEKILKLYAHLGRHGEISAV